MSRFLYQNYIGRPAYTDPRTGGRGGGDFQLNGPANIEASTATARNRENPPIEFRD